MSGPWDDYQNQSGPWDDYAEDLPSQIPGVQKAGTYKDDSSALDKVRGGVEAAITAATGIPAMIAGGVAGLASGKDKQKEVSDKVMQELTYAPRTDKGQEYSEDLGDFANTYLNPLLGGIGHFHIPEKAPKGIDIPSKAAEAFDKVAPTEAGPWQDYSGWGIKDGEKVSAPEMTAKQAEFVNKNQPAATPPNPMQAMADQLGGDRMPSTEPSVPMDQMARQLQTFDALGQMLGNDHNATLLDRAREPKPEAPAPQEPIYVDPQGQAFRGNPADPDAVRALDRQSDAFTQEMWMRPEERAPDGEPLTPLTDVTREPHETIPEDQMAPNASREYDLKENPISSKGPMNRQRGAIATKDIVDSIARGLSGALDKVHEAFTASRFHSLQARDAISTMRELVEENPRLASSVISHTKGELESLGYGKDVLDPLQSAYDHANLLEKAKSSAETPWSTAGKFNQTRKALLNIDKQIGALSDQMEKLIPTRDVSGRQSVINLHAAERGTKQRWSNLAKKVEALNKERESLNIQSPLREENLLTNDFTRPGENSYAVEDVDMDAVRRNLPNEKPSGTGASSKVLPFVPLKQRGAIGDLRIQPRDIAKNEQQRQIAKNFKSFGLDEWDVIRSKDEALALAKDAPDITRDIGQKSLVSGINMETALTNNPILKFARTTFRDTRVWIDQQSKRFVTADKTGLSSLWPKFSTEQRINIMDALMEADKRQVDLSEKVMDTMGFTPEMKQFAETFRSADEALLKKQNENASKLGLDPTNRRVGHFPGIFSGSYKTLVVREGKNGKKQAVAVLATDTRAQQKLAQEYAKKNFPDAKFIEQERGGLAGVSNRYYSDIFSGWNDVMNLLGREDPRFQEVTSIVDKAVLDANNRLFNFNVHELAKKGVVGNEGNKPWMTPKANADSAFKALVDYFEAGFQHHGLQVPLKDMRDVMMAPEADHMPNAKKYLEAYVKKVTGDDLNQLGRALNTIIDQPFRFMPNFSLDKSGNFAAGLGVGPSVPLKISAAIKNNMAHLYMGWFNYMFTLSQMIQPAQTGLPFLQHAASRLGASPLDTVRSMAKGGVDFMIAFNESTSGKPMKGLDPVMRDAFQYAKDRGLFEFSEIERAYQGTKSRLMTAKDRAAEINMKVGEQTTRTPMFMAFADLLYKQGIPKERAFSIAENLTQASMIDYHSWERPMVYSKLGVMGGFMSGLTTFKHGVTSQGAYLGKQLVSPVGGAKRSAAVLPVAYASAAALAFAGLTGSPFYNELDTGYRFLTNHLGGEEKSIRESFLSNFPEWLNSGLVSDATGLNLQSKFSTADMIPDASHPLRAITPYGEGAWNIAKTGYDFAKNQDAQGARNFAAAVTPSGWKGVTENALSKDPNGYLLGKDGLPLGSQPRTPEEWKTRALTGVRSQREAIDRQSMWDARSKEKADTDQRKQIATEYERRLVNNNMDPDSQKKLQDEYQARKGDVSDLLNLWQKAAKEKQESEKQRLEGTPNSLRGYNRWEYFQK